MATVGIGYADGWLRLLKKNSSFIIDDQECRILGNITMDSFVIDITHIKKIALKEESYIKLIDNSNLKNILNKLPISASSLYAKNVFNFVANLYDKENKKVDINLKDEIIEKTLIK